MIEHNFLDIWEKAPPFTARDDQGREVALSDFQGSMIALFFYSRNGAPGCRSQVLGFRKLYPRFQELGVVVIGISPDPVASHAEFKLEHRLPFILLSDPDHLIASRYGVWGSRTIAGESVEGIVRSHFLIGAAGEILHVRRRVEPVADARSILESIEIRKDESVVG